MISTKFPEALKFNHFIFETAKWEEKWDFCDYEMASLFWSSCTLKLNGLCIYWNVLNMEKWNGM